MQSVQRISIALCQVSQKLLSVVLRGLQAVLGLRWSCADGSYGHSMPLAC